MRHYPMLSSLVAAAVVMTGSAIAQNQTVLTGQAAFTDAQHESPGTRRHLTTADLPAPAPDQSVDNGPRVVPRPSDAWPKAPEERRVEKECRSRWSPYH